MKESIVLRYTPTIGDHIQTARAITARPRQFMFLCFPLLFLSGILILVVSSELTVAIILMVFPLFISFLFFVLEPLVLRRLLRKNESLRSEVIWEINEDRVVIKSKLSESSLDWAAFKEVRETRKLYLFKTRTGSFVSIPKRVFESSDQESAFRDMIKSHIEKAQMKP